MIRGIVRPTSRLTGARAIAQHDAMMNFEAILGPFLPERNKPRKRENGR
jgi:hypothetical protein